MKRGHRTRTLLAAIFDLTCPWCLSLHCTHPDSDGMKGAGRRDVLREEGDGGDIIPKLKDGSLEGSKVGCWEKSRQRRDGDALRCQHPIAARVPSSFANFQLPTSRISLLSTLSLTKSFHFNLGKVSCVLTKQT